MDKDFSELIEYLDKKFGKIDNQFTGVSQQFGGVNFKLEGLEDNKADKTDVRELVEAVDAYAKKADTYFQAIRA